MNENKIYLKVAQDMYLSQFFWTISFLGILLFISIVRLLLALQGDEAEGFFNSVFVASNIYMFIIGILAVYFLSYFVGNGVTRKDYFLGATIASVGLSITIPIITIIVYFIEKIILNLIGIQYKVQTINEIELDGNIIGDTIQMMILSPYVDPNENWLLATLVLCSNIFIAYLLGWFISCSFYSYDVIIGLIAIIMVIFLKMIKDTLLRIAIDLPAIGWFNSLDVLPISVAIACILFVILIILAVIRHTTKRVSVKL